MTIEEKIKGIIDLPNTYIGECPIDTPNAQWIKYSSGSSNVHFNKDTYDRPEYTIFVRGTNNKEASERVKLVYDKLKNYTGGEFVILIKRLPHYVGRNEKYQSIYSFRIEYQLGGY